MKKEETIKRIETIISDIERNWTEGGGPSKAAHYVLTTFRWTLGFIREGNAKYVYSQMREYTPETPEESELVQLALSWAKEKLRRQVEDRLRKDEDFLEAVIGLHNRAVEIYSAHGSGECECCGETVFHLSVFIGAGNHPMKRATLCPSCEKVSEGISLSE